MCIELVTKERKFLNENGEHRIVLTTIDPTKGVWYPLSQFSKYSALTIDKDYLPTNRTEFVFELDSYKVTKEFVPTRANSVDNIVDGIKIKNKTIQVNRGRNCYEIPVVYR